MKFIRKLLALAGFALVSGCGGGGGGGSSTAPVPTLNVSLSASSSSASVTEATSSATATVTATVSGTVSTPVVADLTYDKAIFSSATVSPGTAAGTYVINLSTLPNLGGGDYASPVTFRLCQEAACTNVYAGSTVTYTYNLSVKLFDWSTFQRNAAHTGYVHATLDATKFAKAWTWTNPDANLLSGVISGGGNAYVSALTGKVYSFNETTGVPNWTYSSTTLDTFGALAYDNGTVFVTGFVPTTGSIFTGDAAIRGLNASTGTFKSDSPFVSQVREFNSPVISNNEMFHSQGYYGGIAYKYSLPSGSLSWASPYSFANTFGGVSPAVDQNYVYSTTGYGIQIYNKSDGSTYAKVSDTLSFTTGYSDLVSPVIAPSGRIIVGNPQGGYQLIAIDVPSKSIVWRTGTNYNLQPVVAGNIVYGAHNYPFGIDAINEADGSTLWSWSLPATDTRLIENMIVCDNLLFVSSDKAIYAIDLKTHQTAWTYAAQGRLSLSSNFVLYVVGNPLVNGVITSSVTAIKLR